MPALGMAQETGKVVNWLKNEGQSVTQGEPLLEIETDKVTVELEAPATGTLARVSAAAGEDVPVGQVIALILAAGENDAQAQYIAPPPASPVAARIAAEHQVDLRVVRSDSRRVEKADVLAFLDSRNTVTPAALVAASPKARRLAVERGLDLAALVGSGPDGAVLAADVLGYRRTTNDERRTAVQTKDNASLTTPPVSSISNAWRVMAERTTQSWTSVPHFYLLREVDAGRLMAWRQQAQRRTTTKLTYSDLLVRLVAPALREHPRLNASWRDGAIVENTAVNIGLAVATEDGLIVPVMYGADTLGLSAIAARRAEIVERAQAGKLRPDDLRDGTFTISNLGMYGVDAFNAIVNPPQAAILAVGRIAERVVPIGGQPAVRPMLTLSLSCDHRVVDGARGARFLDTLAQLIEEPLGALG
jgi:pyruvate dehydrogenase E2 component (dihydrolipoamide acetyltransferase)